MAQQQHGGDQHRGHRDTAPDASEIQSRRPLRPTLASRSNTTVEAMINTKALAAPPTKRSTRNVGIVPLRPIAAVVNELTVSAHSSQRRRDPGSVGIAASKAAIR
jgi:hypothetical protein